MRTIELAGEGPGGARYRLMEDNDGRLRLQEGYWSDVEWDQVPTPVKQSLFDRLAATPGGETALKDEAEDYLAILVSMLRELDALEKSAHNAKPSVSGDLIATASNIVTESRLNIREALAKHGRKLP